MNHSASFASRQSVVTRDTQLTKINKQIDGCKHKLVVSSWCKFVLEKEEKLKDNKIYNTALYCRLSLDDGSVGESVSIQTQKIILEEYAKIQCCDIT